MRKLLAFLRASGGSQGILACCLLLNFLTAVLSLVLPEILRSGMNAIEARQWPALLHTGWLALASTIATIAITAGSKLLQTHYFNLCQQGWQMQLTQKHMHIRKSTLSSWTAGDALTTIINNAADGVDNAFSAVNFLLMACSWIGLSLAYLGLLQWKLMLILLGYNAVLRVVSVFTERKMKQSSQAVVSVSKENNGFVVRLLRNMLLVRVYDRNGYFQSLLTGKERNTFRTKLRRAAWSNGIMDSTWALAKLAEFVIIYGLGGWMVYRGEMQIGTLIAFIFGCDMLVKGLDSFAEYLSFKATASAEIDSVDRFMQAQPLEDQPALPLPTAPFALRLEDVSFSYGDKAVLEHVSFTLQPGDKVLLKGPNGQGKSTLLRLISGLHRPTQGAIWFGSSNASQTHLSEIAKVSATISQQSDILPGTPQQNIALDFDFDTPRMEDTLRSLGLSQAGDTAADALSQGEKQRLNIGRSLYKEGSTLILGDEIFANVDKANAQQITEILRTRWDLLTVIMIAHEDMDFPFTRVFTVDGGTVTEEVQA